MITIGSTVITAPSQYRVDIDDIVKAERNANGNMIKEIVATKRKISMNWAFLTIAQMEEILDELSANFFSVTYPDPLTNSDRTSTFYAGTKSQGGVKYISGVMTGWMEISVNLIEQ
jgi:hypothetical protein